MSEYITEVSEAIGEINRLAVLANMEQPGSVVVEAFPHRHCISIELIGSKSFGKQNIYYDPEVLKLWTELEIMSQFYRAIGQISNITNRAAQTA